MRRREVDEPTREMLLRAFADTPPEFDDALRSTLTRLQSEKEEKTVKRKLSMAPVLAFVIVMILAVVAVAAALYPQTVERFRQNYGEDYLKGDETAQVNASYTLGDVVYTLTDVVWERGMLFGTVVMTPREGANIVLIPEDHDVSDAAGYAVYYKEEVPEGTPSYRELAKERGARLVMPKCIPDGYVIDGNVMSGDVGYFDTPMHDGSIVTSFELYGWNGSIEHAESYVLQMNPHNWEVTLDGEWLREEPDNTWLQDTWQVEVFPVLKDGTQAEIKAPELPGQTLDTDGLEIVTPDGFDGTLPVYAVSAVDWRRVVKPEWFDASGIAESQSTEWVDTYRFEDGGRLEADGEGNVRFAKTDGMETITYLDGDTFEGEKAAMSSYIAELAFDVYFDDTVFGDAQSAGTEETAVPLKGFTLEEAQQKAETLLERMGMEGYAPVFAYAMDTERIKALGEARNAKIATGEMLNVNPRDVSGVTEADEGYALVYMARVAGVPADDVSYMRVTVFVDREGVEHATIWAPFALESAEGEPQTLITADQAFTMAVEAAEHCWIEEMGDVVRQAHRIELMYMVREQARLVPVWRVTAIDQHWPVQVMVSATDGQVLNAPWM